MLGHERLDEQRAPLGIEAGGDPVGGVVARVRRQLRRVRIAARQRVPVRDEVEAVVLRLQVDPVPQGADEVSEVEPARRPHPGDDPSAGGYRSHDRISCAGGPTMTLSIPVSISA